MSLNWCKMLHRAALQLAPVARWKVSALLGVLDRIEVPPHKGFPLPPVAIPKH